MSIDSAMLYDGSYKQSEKKSRLKGAGIQVADVSILAFIIVFF